MYRQRDGGPPEVLLVHPGGPFWVKRDAGAWSLPKGEYDEAEDPRTCALRELEEELGSAPALGELVDLGTARQKSGKVVQAWAARGDFDPTTLRSNSFVMEWPPRSGRQAEFPEVDRADWFPPTVARDKIVSGQAVFIDRLLEHLDGKE